MPAAVSQNLAWQNDENRATIDQGHETWLPLAAQEARAPDYKSTDTSSSSEMVDR